TLVQAAKAAWRTAPWSRLPTCMTNTHWRPVCPKLRRAQTEWALWRHLLSIALNTHAIHLATEDFGAQSSAAIARTDMPVARIKRALARLSSLAAARTRADATPPLLPRAACTARNPAGVNFPHTYFAT